MTVTSKSRTFLTAGLVLTALALIRYFFASRDNPSMSDQLIELSRLQPSATKPYFIFKTNGDKQAPNLLDDAKFVGNEATAIQWQNIANHFHLGNFSVPILFAGGIQNDKRTLVLTTSFGVEDDQIVMSVIPYVFQMSGPVTYLTAASNYSHVFEVRFPKNMHSAIVYTPWVSASKCLFDIDVNGVKYCFIVALLPDNTAFIEPSFEPVRWDIAGSKIFPFCELPP